MHLVVFISHLGIEITHFPLTGVCLNDPTLNGYSSTLIGIPFTSKAKTYSYYEIMTYLSGFFIEPSPFILFTIWFFAYFYQRDPAPVNRTYLFPHCRSIFQTFSMFVYHINLHYAPLSLHYLTYKSSCKKYPCFQTRQKDLISSQNSQCTKLVRLKDTQKEHTMHAMKGMHRFMFYQLYLQVI